MHRIDDIQAWLAELGGKFDRAQRELAERNREVQGIHAAFDSTCSEAPLEEQLQRIVNLIPSAFFDPEIIGARLTIADKSFVTADFRESRWRYSVAILAQGHSVGALSVHCYAEPSTLVEEPFSVEKRRFFDVLAAHLGSIVRQCLAADQTRQLAEELEVKNQELQELHQNAKHDTMLITKLYEVISEPSPVLQVWDSVLVAPIIGIVDSRRANGIMDKLLAAITERRSRFLIIDITGMETVDTAVALHLCNVARATSLLGATCILTGIKTGVAQTMVSLGIDLGALLTRRTLQDGLRECLQQMGKRSR